MTVTIRNIDPLGGPRDIADTGDVVEHNDTVTLDGEIAERLLEQSDIWKKVTTHKESSDTEETK